MPFPLEREGSETVMPVARATMPWERIPPELERKSKAPIPKRGQKTKRPFVRKIKKPARE